MTPQEATLVKRAHAALQSALSERDEWREKVTQYERERAAEEIAIMLAAEGSISEGDILDKRAELTESGRDLGQMKIALQEYGPGSFHNEAPQRQGAKTAQAGMHTISNSDSSYMQDALSELNQTLDTFDEGF